MAKLSSRSLLVLLCSLFSNSAGCGSSWGSSCIDSEKMNFPSFSNFVSEMNSSSYGLRFLGASATRLVKAAISAGHDINIQKCLWVLDCEIPRNGIMVMESNSSLGIQIMRFCVTMNPSRCAAVAAFHGKQCSSARFGCSEYQYEIPTTYKSFYSSCWSADCSNLSPNYPRCVLDLGIPRCTKKKSWAVSILNTAASRMVASLMLLQLATMG